MRKSAYRSKIMELEVLRKDMIVSQRKGQPFIVASTIIWVSITLVTMMKVSLPVQNLLIFLLFHVHCCHSLGLLGNG